MCQLVVGRVRNAFVRHLQVLYPEKIIRSIRTSVGYDGTLHLVSHESVPVRTATNDVGVLLEEYIT